MYSELKSDGGGSSNNLSMPYSYASTMREKINDMNRVFCSNPVQIPAASKVMKFDSPFAEEESTNG